MSSRTTAFRVFEWFCLSAMVVFALSLTMGVMAHEPNYYASKEGFRVSVHTGRLRDTPVAVVPGRKEQALDGVGAFGLSTQSDYAIRIQLETKGEEFTVESFMVGERPVTLYDYVGSASEVYNDGDLMVKGFTPGGNDSFRFVSVTKGEIARKEVDASVLAKYNEDNVIRIRLRRHTRKRNHAIPRSWGGLEGSPGLDALAGYITTSAPMLSGGTTIDGGQTVDRLVPQRTYDTWTAVGEVVEIVVQLACNQSDAEKEATNARAALHAAGYDYWKGLHAKTEKERDALVAAFNATLTELATKLARWEDIDLPLYDTDEETEQVKHEKAADILAKRDALLLKLE